LIRLTLLVCCAIAPIVPGATTIDRIVAVVGKHAIKQSDIDRDLRVTQFLNQEAPDSSIATQKKSLERLIDQELIRVDMAAAGNTGHLDSEAKDLLAELVRDRFSGSSARLDAELARRGLKQPQLLEQLQWQLVVLRFIDERFRAGILVSDEDVRKYYDEHLQELSKRPGEHSIDALAAKIRESLEGEEVNRNFEQWLAQARKDAVIEYKVDALK
jgi:peptidyl-prolyl cis-trans isomerase SurA